MTTTVLTTEKVEEIMNSSTGTEKYYRPFFFNTMVYTDGVRTFAEQCQAYWVIDLVNSYMKKIQNNHRRTSEWMYFIQLKVKDNKASVRIYREVDEKKKTVARLDIPYTDLPNVELKFYLQLAQEEPAVFCMMTPSEY